MKIKIISLAIRRARIGVYQVKDFRCSDRCSNTLKVRLSFLKFVTVGKNDTKVTLITSRNLEWLSGIGLRLKMFGLQFDSF